MSWILRLAVVGFAQYALGERDERVRMALKTDAELTLKAERLAAEDTVGASTTSPMVADSLQESSSDSEEMQVHSHSSEVTGEALTDASFVDATDQATQERVRTKVTAGSAAVAVEQGVTENSRSDFKVIRGSFQAAEKLNVSRDGTRCENNDGTETFAGSLTGYYCEDKPKVFFSKQSHYTNPESKLNPAGVINQYVSSKIKASRGSDRKLGFTVESENGELKVKEVVDGSLQRDEQDRLRFVPKCTLIVKFKGINDNDWQDVSASSVAAFNRMVADHQDDQFNIKIKEKETCIGGFAKKGAPGVDFSQMQPFMCALAEKLKSKGYCLYLDFLDLRMDAAIRAMNGDWDEAAANVVLVAQVGLANHFVYVDPMGSTYCQAEVFAGAQMYLANANVDVALEKKRKLSRVEVTEASHTTNAAKPNVEVTLPVRNADKALGLKLDWRTGKVRDVVGGSVVAGLNPKPEKNVHRVIAINGVSVQRQVVGLNWTTLNFHSQNMDDGSFELNAAARLKFVNYDVLLEGANVLANKIKAKLMN